MRVRQGGIGLLAALLVTGVAARATAGDLTGRLRVDLPGLRLPDMGPVVVYLESADGAVPSGALAAALLRQKNARFSPAFLVVAQGQTVEMPNDDSIYHNVFSFSAPNDFDLGLYPAGKSRSITFRHPGLVRLYCSIHEGMNGTIYVTPTPWFAVADGEGRYAIRGVPAGRWRVKTWTEKLPSVDRTVEIGAGAASLELSLTGGAKPGTLPAAPAP